MTCARRPRRKAAPVTRTATTAYERDLGHAGDAHALAQRNSTTIPLDVPDDDANDNPEPGAEPRERPAVALDAISDSAIDSLGKPSEGEGAKTKEDTAAQAQRVMAQQTRKAAPRDVIAEG